MKDTEGRILGRQVGKTLTAAEMEAVNGSGPTQYSYPTGPPWNQDKGAGFDWEITF